MASDERASGKSENPGGSSNGKLIIIKFSIQCLCHLAKQPKIYASESEKKCQA